MAEANSIAAAFERLNGEVYAVAALIQIVSTTSVWERDPGASVASLLCHMRDPLMESLEALERALGEKISAPEVAHG